eukprot:TRINITY_DN59107_c0_g1_i1.p1 TRINITY_DN59107_c0_g1~~TRINITY_DN59107_c0_g1_i1.p1  ORF type:complete len:295 (-),score=36.56 TRINITY_DN59107_c0_g1_i1:761-1597(-)
MDATIDDLKEEVCGRIRAAWVGMTALSDDCSRVSKGRLKDYARLTMRGEIIPDFTRHLVQCYFGLDSSPCGGRTVRIVMDFMDKGSMADLIRRMAAKWKAGVPPMELACIIQQTVGGLEYLHSRRLRHYNSKPTNILHSSSGEVKLVDFGCCGFLDIDAAAATPASHLPYMSPERCLGEASSLVCDTWSFGMVTYELACGRHPWAGIDSFPALFEAMCEKPEPRLDLSECHPEVCRFVASCLIRDVHQRPDAVALMQDVVCTMRACSVQELAAFVAAV